MLNFIQTCTLVVIMIVTGSCNNVGFTQKSGDSAGTVGATNDGAGGNSGRPTDPTGGGPGGGDPGTPSTPSTPGTPGTPTTPSTPGNPDPGCANGGVCPPPGVTYTYGWHESGFGLCSLACGTGNQAQIVDCRRSPDNVVVADQTCTGTKPVATRTCNANACTGINQWNLGDFGACSKSCGGGIATRTVVCQTSAGQVVADGQCPTTKPVTSQVCNADACPGTSYAWTIKRAFCPLTCANTVPSVTDGADCVKNDGTVVADGFCGGGKPAAVTSCNQAACPQTYTYAWLPGNYSDCDKTCGGGVQTRSLACQRNDGAFVNESFCPANKPTSSQPCGTNACAAGTRAVTQYATVAAAANAVDVVLIIDDSSSMKDDQTKLATRMSTLLSDLDAQNVDYQVCLTTTDVGYYAGSPLKWQGLGTYVMTKNSPNKNQVFLDTINGLGAEWSSDEQAIKATYLMIKNFAASGCIRPRASLATIVISDEDERSVGGDQSLSKAQYQPLTPENMPVNLMGLVHSTYDAEQFIKPFIWNSIIDVPNDRSCMIRQDQDVSPSFFGKLYAQLSNLTGGAVGSICDADYTQNLKFIKDRVVNNLPGIMLECAPVDTPVVSLNPSFITSISIQGNQMKFSPALPEGTQFVGKYTCAN